MKRIFVPIAIILTAFIGTERSFANSPFDNGEPSLSLEANAVYQAILTFNNGSGFCYFSPTANFAANGIAPGQATISETTQVLADTRANINNRMVCYYKGMTYVGSAFGTTDYEARQVQCSMNGSTNANQAQLTANTTSLTAGGYTNAATSVANSNAISQIVINNSSSFTVNGDFTGQITETAPTLRFKGKGEMSFISPNVHDEQAGLQYTGFSGLINAIVTAVGNANVGANFDPSVFTQAEVAIQNAVSAVTLSTTVDEAYQSAEVQPLTVQGFRRYL